MVAAYFALGTELQIETGTPGTFATIPGVQSIDGPGATRDTIDVTSHSSTGGYREFIGGLRDGGEITATINWLFDDATQLLLQDAYEAEGVTNFRVVYPMSPGDEYDEFAGFVTDLSKASPTDAQTTASLTIKITGPVTRVEP